jgi:hypothetical protein
MKKNKKNPGDSNKESESDFPGYPHYKQDEDIMDRSGKMGRIEMDLDSTTGKISPLEIPDESKLKKGIKGARRGRRKVSAPGETDEIKLVPGNDADVSAEEKNMLENEGQLQDKMYSPSDLDVPGSELDDESENIGSEDEENNYYSLGGDDKENLEENTSG